MKKFYLCLISVLSIFLFSCSWGDDGFYANIENEVKIANAPVINVFVRYAMTRQGKTEPDGYASFKVGIPQLISATTEPEYGFVRWAAFTTDFISVGDNQNRNKDIYFIDNEDYSSRILPHELSNFEVSFTNPNSASTSVTINVPRNDICLVPIIAQRPSVALSIPANGSSGVVRNMAVRISFSKPMNPQSFKSSDGSFDKITITQGIQTFSSTGDLELNSEDITDHFEFNDEMFSANKKMITLKFTEAALSEGYASQSSVNITISKDVKDIYGFTMADDNKIGFSVGSRKDTLAPRISWLSAGVGNQFYAFPGVFKDNGTKDSVGSMTKITHEGAALAPTDDINAAYYNPYITNRLGRDAKIVLRVFAEDLAGSGSGQSHDGIESDVTLIALRAKHLYNADGSPDAALTSKSMEYKVYVPLQNNTSLAGSYRELVNAANAALPQGTATYESSYGSLFEYDISDLPDGLIQVDVAAVDVVQNIGFFDGGNYSAEYGNGYASVFIVKDTTPPDAEANKNHVQADLSIVPNGRGMFNAQYYSQLAVSIAKDSNNVPLITDPGHTRFMTPSSQIKWIVAPDTGTNWAASVSPSDSRWRLITDNYPLSNTPLPAQDGPVSFTYALMDNLGNISNAVSFNSITYDNTVPSLAEPGITGINGYSAASITGNVLENQVLSIPVTEVTSGLERLDVEIACVEVNGTEVVNPSVYATPFASNSLEILVNGSPVPYTVSGTHIDFTTPITGTFTVSIKGLQIADAGSVQDNSKYRISVKARDAAMNVSSQMDREIGCDSTPPVINYVKVKNISSGISEGLEEYWSTEPSALTSLYISLTETNTGARVFDFTGSAISLRPDTALIYNGNSLPVSIDSSFKKLTITDENQTVRTSSTGGELVINNVSLAANNTVNLKVSDLVTNTSAATTAFTLENSSVINSFKYDNALPVIDSVILKDQAAGPGGSAESGYTDSEYVEAVVHVTAAASGIYQIRVNNASFDNTTLVNNSSASDANNGFTITDNNTITLKTNSNTKNRIIKGTFNITIGNVKLQPGDGNKTVSFTVTSLNNKASAAAQSSIVLDKTAPVWSGDGVYSSGNPDTSIIYPHTSTSTSGNVLINGNIYFYTQNTINIAAAVTEANRKTGNLDLYIDNAGPVSAFENVAPGTHDIYAVDKAGNKSDVKRFYVVEDTGNPAAFSNYICFEMPASGSIYRGNPDTGSTKNYVIKQTSEAYRILVKLTGVNSTDKKVDGSNCSNYQAYGELNAQPDKSPIEYYAFSTNGVKTWEPIVNGLISIQLPSSGTISPYTVYIKDGCGNESSYEIPVNWKVDGSINSVTQSNLSLCNVDSDIVTNTYSKVNYYRGASVTATPLIKVTGFNDSCYYLNNNTSDGKYTIRSRLLVIPEGQTLPSDLSTLSPSLFTDWKLYKSTGESDSFDIQINYPQYDTNNPYNLYLIIEDTLGNRSISQLIKNTDGVNCSLWLWDNDAPEAVVDSSSIQKVNTIDNKNYYSASSSVKYTVSDPKSGIKNDGSTTYDDLSSIPKILSNKNYPLGSTVPDSNEQLTISGMEDFAGNAALSQGLIISKNGTDVSHWIKQAAPVFSAVTITAKDVDSGNVYSRTINDYTTGAKTFKETVSNLSSQEVHTILASRSVTSIKVNLTVSGKKYNPEGSEIDDNSPLLGWIIRDSAITSPLSFYSADNADIQALQNNEYVFDKTETNTSWYEHYNGTKYFYAVNRAGIITTKPIVIKFAQNPIPAISGSFTYSNVISYSGINVNFLKADSTVTFNTNVKLSSATGVNAGEIYIGSNSPVGVSFADLHLNNDLTDRAYKLTSSHLSGLSENTLKIKLFTETEVSELISIPGPVANNSWSYDAAAPEIIKIKLPGLTRGRESDSELYEYWSAGSDKTDVLITLSENRSGVKEFDFNNSTVKLTSNSKLYKISAGSETLITAAEVDTVNNRLTINDYNSTIKGNGNIEVRITDLQLRTFAEGTNSLSLKLFDLTQNESLVKSEISYDDTTTISSFNYDPNSPTVTSLVLSDRSTSPFPAETGFTNERYVNVEIPLSASTSGIYQLTLSGASCVTSGADMTTINVGGSLVSYTSTDGNTIAFSSNKVIKGNKTLNICNLLLPATDGSKTVTVRAVSLCNKQSAEVSNEIVLDTQKPQWQNDGVFVANSNSNVTSIYPHSSNSSSGNVKIGGVVYFYTKDTINIAADVADTNRKAGNIDLYIDSSDSPVSEFNSVASGSHSVYVVDKAGNKSALKSFYVVEDITAPTDIADQISFVMPSGGNIFRGNGMNYVIKQINDGTPYKIIVKLGGVAAGDLKISGGSYAAAGSSYPYQGNSSVSPLEYYKITGDSVNGSGSVNTDWTLIPANGSITVELPKSRDCNALKISLKDGCGNESAAFDLGAVSWCVDGQINNPSATYSNVTTNAYVNYYNTSASLTLTCDNDSCFYSGEGEGSSAEYTLKSRLLALPASETLPADLSSLDSSLFTEWKYRKATSSTSNIVMTHNLPQSGNYKLYYIVEDTVGNTSVAQITENQWQFDNTTPVISDISFAKVYSEGSNRYYSDNSTVTYTVTDSAAGIRKSDNSIASSETKTVYLKDILESAVPVIKNISDIVGNTITPVSLPAGESGISWTRYTAAPDSAKTGVNITNASGTSEGIESAATSPVIKARRSLQQIKLSFTYTGSDELLGWIKSDTELSSFSDYYDTVTINSGAFDSLTKADAVSVWPQTQAYYYAVNKAGLICQTPVIVTFAANPIPAINGDITWTGITAYGSGDSAVNFIKAASEISFTAENLPSQYQIFDGTDTALIAKTDFTSPYTISLASFTSLSSSVLKLKLYTASEDSDFIALTGPASNNKWSYDNTAPEFTMSVNDAVEKTGVYYVNGDNAGLSFAAASEDILKYEYKITGGNWADLESPYQLAVTDAEARSYVIRAVDKAGNLSTETNVSVQKDAAGPVGSLSHAITRGSSPVVTALAATDSASGDYILTEDNVNSITTVIYNPAKVDKITLTPSAVTDAGAGSPYIVLDIDNTEEQTPRDASAAIEIELASSWTTEKTYKIIAKDALTNSTVLKTYKFKAHGSVPAVNNELTGDNAVAYSGLPLVPTYPKVDETENSYNANLESNRDYWIKGFDTDSNYAKTDGDYQKQGITGGYNVVTYTKGTPGSTLQYTTTNNNWNSIYVSSDTLKLKLPVKANSLPSNKLYYKVTYNDVREPSDGWTAAEVKGSGDNGYIENVTVEKANISCELTFIFAWYKDELGNICVHNLTYPVKDSGKQHLYINWWSKEGATVSTDSGNNVQIPFSRSVASGNPFANGFKVLLEKFNNVISAPLKTRSIDLTSPDFETKDKSSVTASSPKKLKKIKKSGKKTAAVKPVVVQSIIEEAASRNAEIEKIKEFTEIAEVTESAGVTKASEASEFINLTEGVQVEKVTANTEIKEITESVISEPVREEESVLKEGKNTGLLYAALALLLASIIVVLAAMVKMLKKKSS